MANDLPPPPPPPPSPPPSGAPKAAYVEEYNEETQVAHPETRQTANISSKRSKPDVRTTRHARDEFSDSGRSSQTVATLESSAPSSLESKPGSNPPKVEETTAASKRKPTGKERIAKSRPHSPEEVRLRRTGSKSQKDKHAQPEQPCDCAECKTSRRPVETSRRQEGKSKSKSKPMFGFLRSSKPSPVQRTPDPPVLHPPARPRAITSQSYQQGRPVSLHGSYPEPSFMPQQPLIIERQPSYPQYPYVPSSYPPPFFPPPPSVQPHPDFYIPPPSPQMIRPRSQQWPSGNSLPSRPHSMYYDPPPPLVEYGEDPIYTTIAPAIHPPSRQPSHRERPRHSPEEPPARLEDYYRRKMPPPPPPPQIKTHSKPEQRPAMMRPHTTSDAHPSLHKRRSVHDESTKLPAVNRSPVKQNFADRERSRRPDPKPTRRSDETVARVQSIERSVGRTHTGKSEKRRASIYGHETLHDLEAEVEDYQAAHKGPAPTPPIPIDTLVRRKKPTSDTSSRQSGKSGKSKNSREGSDVTRSRRQSSDVKTRTDNDKFALRFNASQDINFDLKGGIEGRTISVRPSKDGDGDMELSIGSRGRAQAAPSSSRPPVTGREKSRRRYSYIEGQGVTDVERPKLTPRTSSSRSYAYHASDDNALTQIEHSRRPGGGRSTPRSQTYHHDGRGVVAPLLERTRTGGSVGEVIREEGELGEQGQAPRIVSERVTVTSRSRRSSRGGTTYRP